MPAMAPKLVLTRPWTRHALRNLCSPCHTRSHSTLCLDHRPDTRRCRRSCMYHYNGASVKAAAHVAHALRNLCSPCHTRSHSILFLDHRPGTSHCWRMCTYHCIAAEAQAVSHAPHALRNLCSLCRTRSHSTPFLDHRPGTSHYWRRCMCCSTMWSESTQAEAVFRPLRCQLESELSGDSAQAHQSRACERVSTVQYSSAASQLRRRLHVEAVLKAS